MPIRFACQHCGQRLSVTSNKAGMRARCPKCKKSLTIPRPDPAATPVLLAEENTAAAERTRAISPNVGGSPSPTPPPPPPATPPAIPAPPAPPPAVPPTHPVPTFAALPEVEYRPDDAGDPTASASIEVPLVTESSSFAADDRSSSIFPHDAARNHHSPPPETEVEWTYEDVESAARGPRAATRATTADGRVAIPRYVVFTQGFLLALVAIVCFGLGHYVGGGRAPVASSSVASPCVVSGQIHYTTSGGTQFPDEGAAILVVPQNERPEANEKIAIESLRPSEPPPTAQQEPLQGLRQLGGGYARADVNGEFRIPLPRAGRYYLLIISHYGPRRPGQEINKADLAQLGRYVTSAGDLLGDRRYRWRSEEIRKDVRLAITLD